MSAQGVTIGRMTKPQVLILQHVPWERPGRILSNLEDLALDTLTLNVAAEKKPDLPDLSELAGVVIMGGPMGATQYGKFPGLKTEAKLVKAAVGKDVPVLGVCLGHQIIATALGAKLSQGSTPEIGIGAVKSVDKHDYYAMWSKQLQVLHWHNDVVMLPEGAQLLASSPLTKVQAFRAGSALGLQFHLEVTPVILEEWLSELSMVKELKAAGGSKQQLRDQFAEFAPQFEPFAEQVFSGFAARCSTRARALG